MSPEAIQKFAEFVVEYLKITDQFAQIADSSAYGQFDQLMNFCKNNGIAPFAGLGRWEKSPFVLNGMPYQENILSIDLILQRRGFTVQFFVRTGNAKIQEVCEKAGLVESFPEFENNRVYTDVSFEKINDFLTETRSKLSKLISSR